MQDVHSVERGPIAPGPLFPSTNHGDGLIEEIGDARISDEVPKEPLGSPRLRRQERMEVSLQLHADVVVPSFFSGPGFRCANRNQHPRRTWTPERRPQEHGEKPIEVPQLVQRQCLDETRGRVEISPGPMSSVGSFLPFARVEVHVGAE